MSFFSSQVFFAQFSPLILHNFLPKLIFLLFLSVFLSQPDRIFSTNTACACAKCEVCWYHDNDDAGYKGTRCTGLITKWYSGRCKSLLANKFDLKREAWPTLPCSPCTAWGLRGLEGGGFQELGEMGETLIVRFCFSWVPSFWRGSVQIWIWEFWWITVF